MTAHYPVFYLGCFINMASGCLSYLARSTSKQGVDEGQDGSLTLPGPHRSRVLMKDKMAVLPCQVHIVAGRWWRTRWLFSGWPPRGTPPCSGPTQTPDSVTREEHWGCISEWWRIMRNKTKLLCSRLRPLVCLYIALNSYNCIHIFISFLIADMLLNINSFFLKI